MSRDQVELQRIQRALQVGKRLTDAQVSTLGSIRRAVNAEHRFVGVSKAIELREGEELMDFAWTVMAAVQTNRVVLADGSLDAWLVGIFSDHVIVEDGNTGRLFKSEFSRDAKGEFTFSEPVEVRQVFVPVTTASPADGDQVAAAKSLTPAFELLIDISKRARKWDFLPPTIRDKG